METGTMTPELSTDQRKRQRIPITLQQRRNLREHAHTHPEKNQAELQQWFQSQYDQKISQSSVSDSLSPKYSKLDTTSLGSLPNMRVRKPPHIEVEKSLYLWIVDKLKKSSKPNELNGPRKPNKLIELAIPGDDIREQAARIWCSQNPDATTTLQFSRGWLSGFKRRYETGYYEHFGEDGGINASVATKLAEVQRVTQKYDSKDIYICDESVLFWKITPNGTYPIGPVAGDKNHADSYSFHLCCNADGSDKFPVWFIGRRSYPPCFGSENQSLVPYDCVWRANKTAQMTTEIMTDWLLSFDEHVGEKDEKRKVLLLMANSKPHQRALLNTKLFHTKVYGLPPHSAGLTQTFDRGMLWVVKCVYHTYLVDFLRTESDEITARKERKAGNMEDAEDTQEAGRELKRGLDHPGLLFNSIKWLMLAWGSLDESQIGQYWRISGFLNGPLCVPSTEDTRAADKLSIEAQQNALAQALAESVARLYRISASDIRLNLENLIRPEGESVNETNGTNGGYLEPIFKPETHLRDEPIRDIGDEENSIADYSRKHREALTHFEWALRYEEQQETYNKELIDSLTEHIKVLKARRRASHEQNPTTEWFPCMSS